MQFIQYIFPALLLFHEIGFRQFQRQTGGWHGKLLQLLKHVRNNIPFAELMVGNIDAHPEIRPVSPPFTALCGGLAENPAAQLVD